MNDGLSIWARALLYVGAVVTIGRGLTALRASADDSSLIQGRQALRVVTWLGALALLVAPAVLARQQLLALEMPWSELGMLMRETGWGRGFRMLVVAATSTALVLCLPPGRRTAWLLVALATLLSVAMGGLGHAAASVDWPVGARVLDAAHVWTVGAWMGGLLYAWLTTGAETTSPDRAVLLWRRFSALATVVAPLAVVTGMLSGLRVLNGLAPRVIVGSEYGQMLLVKSALVAVALGIGAVQRNRIARGEWPARRSVLVELGLAAWALLVTATLTGTEPPGE